MGKNSYLSSLIVNLYNLPKDQFNISLPKRVIKEILDDITIDSKKLCYQLSKLESQKNIKFLSIKKNFLAKWKNGNRIPIDVFIFLCKKAKKDVNEYQKFISEIFLPSSQNGWKIKFPIYLNKDYFSISEVIRTEGCLMKGRVKNKPQGIAIANKDVFLLRLIEKLNIKLKINKQSICRILNVILYFNKKPLINQVINLNNNDLMHFHYNKGRLTILDSTQNFKLKNKYKIIYENKNSEILSVYVNKNNTIKVRSKTKSTAFITLQIYNSTFAKFLHSIFKIDFGIGNKKTYNIDFPFNIKKLSKDILKNIINMVISCEGHVYYRFRGNRNIIIKIASRKYLEKIRRILMMFNIESSIWNKKSNGLYILTISRKENLLKLNDLIELYINYKKNKLKEIINSYLENRFEYFKANKKYLSLVHSYGPISLRELSQISNKKYKTLITVFYRLDKKGFLEKKGRKNIGTGSTPWIYDLSEKGKNYLIGEL